MNQLSELESNIRHVLNLLPFSALLVDADQKILAVNEAMKTQFDLDETRLVGAYCPQVIRDSGIPLTDCPLEDTIEKGKPVEMEVYDQKASRWISAAAYPTTLLTADGKPTCLHFIRDVTEFKKTATDLKRSLEHHKALCDLLQDLQLCRDCSEILDVLIDKVISLSWLGMAATAVGFLLDGRNLEMAAHRNITPAIRKKCSRVSLGECLCGKTAETGESIECSSDSKIHDIHYEGMDAHRHAVLPIRHKGRILGVLTLYLNPGDRLDDFRRGFLEAATAAAAAALDAQMAKEQVLESQEKYLAQVISSQEEERKRVAGDLHDELCQSLSAILLEIQSDASRNLVPGCNQKGLEHRIRDLIDQVRRMAGQLRPAILDDFGLESALTRKIEEISAARGVPIDYQCVSTLDRKDRLPAAVEVGLYRVTAEALENAITHASASRISVVLLWQREKVAVLVEDDGCGFDYRAVRRNMDRCRGILSMEERMALLGGNLRIEASPRKGTTVRAEVPSVT